MDSGVPDQGVAPPPLLQFNCLVAGDKSDRAFVIDIAGTSRVSHLKGAIKEDQHPNFSNIPADALDLWQVSIPFDGDFDERFERLKLVDKSRLSPMTKLSNLSSQLAEEHLHIVVKAPPFGGITELSPCRMHF